MPVSLFSHSDQSRQTNEYIMSDNFKNALFWWTVFTLFNKEESHHLPFQKAVRAFTGCKKQLKLHPPLGLPLFFFAPSFIIVFIMVISSLVTTIYKPKFIGSVAVDSGVISVIDHTHIKVNDTGSIDLPSYNLYTAINTEIGDGEYKIYECRDDKGGLRKIIIDIQ